MAIDGAAFGEYINRVQGHYIDMDRVFGAQCWDQWAHYASEFLGVPLPITYTNRGGWNPHPGYACNVYHHAATSGLAEWFEILPANAAPRAGDVAFWEFGSAFYSLSHVATVIEVTANGMLRCLTQNPGRVQIANLTRHGLIGYLRPKGRQENKTPQELEQVRAEIEDEMKVMYARATTNSSPTKKGDPASSRVWASPENGRGTRTINGIVYSGVWAVESGVARRITSHEWEVIEKAYRAAGIPVPVADVHGNTIEVILVHPPKPAK